MTIRFVPPIIDPSIDTRLNTLSWIINIAQKQKLQHMNAITRKGQTKKKASDTVYLQGSIKGSYPTIHLDIPKDDQSREWSIYLYILTECLDHATYYIHPKKEIFDSAFNNFNQDGAIENDNYLYNPRVVNLTEHDVINKTFEIKIKVINRKDQFTKQKLRLTKFHTEEPFQNVHRESACITETFDDFPGDLTNFHLACVLTCDNEIYGLCISDLATTHQRTEPQPKIVSAKNKRSFPDYHETLTFSTNEPPSTLETEYSSTIDGHEKYFESAQNYWDQASNIQKVDTSKTYTPQLEQKVEVIMADLVPDTSPIINCYNLACVYRVTGRFDEALNACEQALSLTAAASDSINIARVHSARGSIYFSQEKYEDALKSYRMALNIALVHLSTADPLIDQYLNNVRLLNNKINEK
ncbi:unnamed protein product [Adineta steineri]|uniref:Uncharacterized protein n=1 Tax=Adineta steineri TaxID=433720 RepID=A0A819RNQ0_9BILA|nr:unnamed protein product [Adineta steineri]